MTMAVQLSYPSAVLQTAIVGAEKARLDGASYRGQVDAADVMIRAYVAGREVTELVPKLRAIREKHDAAWAALVCRLASMTEAG
jgi:hypothetical protein